MQGKVTEISIHASPKGSDLTPSYRGAIASDFNPRFPEGKRLAWSITADGLTEFQSTLPRREATRRGRHMDGRRNDFNPRFPEGKRPGAAVRWLRCPRYFNPRFPEGKRPRSEHHINIPNGFQSTLPRREATRRRVETRSRGRISIHASPKGSDRIRDPRQPRRRRISIHASPKGSDWACRWRCRPWPDFNPRFPEGKRL